LAALLVLAPAAGEAQWGPEAPAFGLASRTNITLVSFDFVPRSIGGFFAEFPNSPNRYLSGPHVAAVRLPNGAAIEELEIEGCDGSNPGQIVAELKRAGAPGLNEVLLATANTGAAAIPGCGLFEVPVTPVANVNNGASKYWVEVNMAPGDGSVRIAAVRVRYRLQVSAAPGVATFPNDVPTSHPYFRFIEALAASGITAGCAPNSYCPDDPISRGQMAVFLSAALGLHFPN
jgi:hypothetical protein